MGNLCAKEPSALPILRCTLTREEFQIEINKMHPDNRPIWICKIDVTAKGHVVTETNSELETLSIIWEQRDHYDTAGVSLAGSVKTKSFAFEYEIDGQDGSYEIYSIGMIVFEPRSEIPELEFDICK